MFCVSNLVHPQYGKVVFIQRAEEGNIETPFFAMQAALKNKRLWKAEGAKNVRFLVIDQIMTLSQINRWIHEEYQGLPKCANCAKILHGDVHTHQLGGDSLFCSPDCSGQDYHTQMEKLKDEEEIDYL